MRLLPFVIAITLSICGCHTHKETLSATQANDSVSSDVGFKSEKSSDFSALFSTDRALVLSGIDIFFSPPARPDFSGDSIAPRPTNPLPSKIRIDRMEVKENQNALLSAHSESQDSLTASVDKTASKISQAQSGSNTDVFKPPAFLLILSFSVPIVIIIFIIRLLYKHLRK